MLRLSIPTALLCAGLLIGLAWYGTPPTPASDKAAVLLPAQVAAESSAATLKAYRASAPASQAGLSPFAPSQSPRIAASLPTPEASGARQQFTQLLMDYRSGGLAPEDKIRIRLRLRDLQRDPATRALLFETFFSTQAHLAEAVYGLIRDADLKDITLLEGLIQHERTVANSMDTRANRSRILDLIADLNTQSHLPYSAQIDDYLKQIARHADPQLRNTAAAQRIWYLNQHQPYNWSAQEAYLADTAPTVRAEVYSLLEARLASQTIAGQAQLVGALNTALKMADSAEEKARAQALLLALTSST